jgi:hypothetical protein
MLYCCFTKTLLMLYSCFTHAADAVRMFRTGKLDHDDLEALWYPLCVELVEP